MQGSLSPLLTGPLWTLEHLRERGAEAVILGCTEIGMLLDAPNGPLPVSGTTLIHVETALTWALPGRES